MLNLSSKDLKEIARINSIKGYKSMSEDRLLKPDSHLSKKIFICFIEIPYKNCKNAFCYILKALFVLKIFKFSSLFFGHVEKTA